MKSLHLYQICCDSYKGSAQRLGAYFLLATLALSLPVKLFAATEAFTCIKKSSAEKTLLKNVQTTYEQVSSFHSKFQQESYLHALDVTEESSGRVWFAKPGKMKWHYSSPEEQIFLLKDNTYWFYQDLDKQLLIDDLQQAFHSDLPISFLMGIGEIDKKFSLQSACITSHGKLLTLAPKGKEGEEGESLETFKLVVDQKDSFPIAAQIKDVSGNTTSIVLQNTKRGESQSAVFQPNFPENIDVLDKRARSKHSTNANSQSEEAVS